MKLLVGVVTAWMHASVLFEIDCFDVIVIAIALYCLLLLFLVPHVSQWRRDGVDTFMVALYSEGGSDDVLSGLRWVYAAELSWNAGCFGCGSQNFVALMLDTSLFGQVPASTTEGDRQILKPECIFTPGYRTPWWHDVSFAIASSSQSWENEACGWKRTPALVSSIFGSVAALLAHSFAQQTERQLLSSATPKLPNVVSRAMLVGLLNPKPSCNHFHGSLCTVFQHE